MTLASKTTEVKYERKIRFIAYPAGRYDSNTSYVCTEAAGPFVEQEGQYYAMYKQGTWLGSSIGRTPKEDYAQYGSDATWRLMDKYKALIVEMFFADYAKLGSAIFLGDYMFSQYGVKNGVQSNEYQNFNPDNIDLFRPNVFIDWLNGYIEAANCKINGEINSRKGSIGGFEIGYNRIGISGGISGNNDGMFLYPNVLGFNNGNKQVLVGPFSNLGYEALARFQDTVSSFFSKYGVLFNITGGYKNFAFSGKGDGVLNGLMTGYKLWLVTSRNGNTLLTINKIEDNTLIYICTHNRAYISLPTIGAIQSALNIGSSENFGIIYTVVSFPKSTYGSRVYGKSTEFSSSSYPELFNQNGDTISFVTLNKGASLRFYIGRDNGQYMAFQC